MSKPRLQFPKFNLNKSQKLWLKTTYEKSLNGLNFSYLDLRKELMAKLPKEFSPSEIAYSLLQDKISITLLGILQIDPETEILETANQVLKIIQEGILSKKGIKEIDVDDIAKRINRTPHLVSWTLGLIAPYGNFYNGSSKANDSPYWQSFRFDERSIDETFEQYLKFDGIEALINGYYLRQNEDSIKDVSETMPKSDQPSHYLDPSRLSELRQLDHKNFDLSRLIRICEELETAHNSNCFITIPLLTRSMLDHVSPIFGKSSFKKVAEEYGTRSFKEHMSHLDKSLRKIADANLHTQIRPREILPNSVQVNFINDIDVLLAEIVRILK